MAGSKDQEMNVFMNITKTAIIKVNQGGTIKDLKKLLREKEIISASEDLDDLRYNGQKLEDQDKLVQYGIQANSTLHLVAKNLDIIKLIVHIPSDQSSFELEACIQDTVKNIATLIHNKEGLNSDSYSLYYMGKQMEDNKTLASCNIRTNALLFLVFHPTDSLSVSVKMPGGEILKPEVKVLHTVRDLKAILGSMLGYHVGQQILVFEGVQLEDSRTLAHYNIGLNSTLEMLPFMFQIFLKDWNRKIMALNVRGDDKVSKVKGMILDKLGVPYNFWKLVFAGRFIDDERSLDSYNIQKDCTLNIVYVHPSTSIPRTNKRKTRR